MMMERFAGLARSIPIACACLFWLVSMVRPGMADAVMSFDGKQSEVGVAGDGLLNASDIGDLSIKVTRRSGTEDGAIFLRVAGATCAFTLAYSLDNSQLDFIDEQNKDIKFGTGLNARPDHLVQLSFAQARWVIKLDGATVGTLSAPGLVPKEGERLTVAFGGPKFVGTVGVTGTSRDGLPYLVTTSAGQVAVRTLPRPGIYIESDTGGTEVKQANVTGVTPDHHGIFQKQTFYAISTTTDGVAVAVDWGGILNLVPDPNNLRRYMPKSPADRWAGSVEFEDEPASEPTPQFKGVGSFATPALPFVKNGVTYVMLPPRAEGEGEQQIGSVWATSNFPPNFKYSLSSCYNMATMSLEDLQISGCGANGLFALPPAKSGNYTNDAAPNIVPFGWKWNKLVVGESTVFSTLMASSNDTTSAYSGSSSSGFNILGYYQSRNTTSEREMRSLAGKEEMEQVQQFFQREFSLVLDPREVRLDPCFIRRVLRASAGMKAMQIMGVADPSKLTPDQMPKGPDYFEPAKSYQACPERLTSSYPVTQFVPAYGTHYANAITYGARAVRKVQYRTDEVLKMVRDHYSLDEKSGFEVKATVSAGSKEGGSVTTEIKGGAESGTSTSNGSSNTTTSTYKVESSGGKCYGGISCGGDMITVGREPVPVYLDLLRLDQLLAPPFFTDLAVIRDLRQAVAGEIDKALASTEPAIPPVLRVIDVTFDSMTCSYPSNLQDKSGKLLPLFQFVAQACTQTYHTAVAAYSSDTTSTKLLRLQLTNPDAAAGAAVRSDTPPLGEMMICSAATDCARPRYRLILAPRFDTSGTPAINQQVGFQLFENAGRAAALVPNCKGPCLMSYSFPMDGWLSSEPALQLGWREPITVATNYLGFSQTKPVPPTVSGVAASFDRSAKDYFYSQFGFTSVPARWFTATLSLKLQEQDLPGVLGFKAGGTPPGQGATLSLNTLEPADAFPWKFGDPLDNSGMFLRCTNVFGVGNCEMRGLIVYAKPAAQRK